MTGQWLTLCVKKTDLLYVKRGSGHDSPFDSDSNGSKFHLSDPEELAEFVQMGKSLPVMLHLEVGAMGVHQQVLYHFVSLLQQRMD